MERPRQPPDPPLSDGRVTLRPWSDADVPALVALCNGDEDLAYWLELPVPYTESDARDYLAAGARGWRGEAHETPFAMTDATTGEVLGACGVSWRGSRHGVAEIGYWTARGARGRGVATRAVRLVARWVLGDLGFERLQLRADTLNLASIRVAEKAGLTKEGVIRSERWNARAGRRVDSVMYSLLRAELDRVSP